MKYLKIYTDFEANMELLGDAEKGRLFVAMLKYAESGTEPQLSGNERYVWPSARKEIDRCRDNYIKKADIARNNAQQRTSDDIVRYRTISNDIVSQSTISCQEKEKDKDKDKEKDKEKEIGSTTTPNPSGASAGAGSLAAYISSNLIAMSPGNYEELRGYMEDGFPDELLRWAVDEASAQGKRTWGYVRSIVNRLMVEGVKTVGEAKANAAARQKQSRASPPSETDYTIPDNPFG